MRKIARLFARPRSELILIAQCFALLLAMRIALSLTTYKYIARWLAGTRVAATPSRHSRRQILSAVETAARFIPRATCLTRALAAQRLMMRSGVYCAVRLGVTRRPNGDFGAHAWLVENEDVLIGGAHDLSQYTVLTDLRPAGP